MSEETLRERLRASTRALHDELERVVDIDRRIATRRDYRAHLLRLWALHTAIEQTTAHFDFAPMGFTYCGPHRSGLLERDLEDLGIMSGALTALKLPRAPVWETPHAALGSLYVVEGSAKGARAILPIIRARLGYRPEHGAAYFYGFGAETAALWRAIVAAINRIDPESDAAESACAGARATFALFHHWLDPARADPAEDAILHEAVNPEAAPAFFLARAVT